MSHITHPSTLYPVPFSVKNLMAGLVGVGISLVLFFIVFPAKEAGVCRWDFY